MRTVRDESGKPYQLLKESGDASLVRDPETGERRYLDNDRLGRASGESPLVAAARAVPEPVRRLVTAVREEWALGLLVELDERGPTDVRTLLDACDRCESDLHGVLAEFGAAGLLEEVEVGGARGYAVTDEGREALDRLR